MANIDIAQQTLISRFLPSTGAPLFPGLVTAIAIGIPPATTGPESLIIFLDPAVSDCEEFGIQAEASIMTPYTPVILRASPFEGAGTMPGDAIAPCDRYQYNIPPIAAGTFGMVAVTAAGNQYAVTANHVLGNNGRTLPGTRVFDPGPVYDAAGGAVIAKYTDCVPLIAPAWPVLTSSPSNNTVDCAWAELTPKIHLGGLSLITPPQPPATAATGTPVTKLGRTTGLTNSVIAFRSWCGFYDIGTGTYFFENQLGTYEPAGTEPFSAPGDSGAAVLESGSATCLGLVCARGYHYGSKGEFHGYIVLICQMQAIIQAMEGALGPLTFYTK